MKSVREWCDPDDWTAEVRMVEGVLPDPEAWEAKFRDFVGDSLTIRGIEVAVDGTLVEVDGQPALRIEGGPTLRLATLERKVQWDPKRKAERPATEEERDARRRLLDRTALKPGRVARFKVTGPLRRPARKGEAATLEVRTFAAVEP